jgi:O-acetyl-ADP-ribose deacetylase (regulator of RNase III)
MDYPSRATIQNTTLDLVRGDITRQDVDAIVNAANSSLLGGGGVDGAIHQAAGPQLLEETRQIGGCPTGEARISGGYKLPAEHVIHAVGPVYGNENAPELLASAHRHSLQLAQEHDLETIAFPAISTGIYGYPLEEAAPIALGTVCDYVTEQQPGFKLVRFVLFNDTALNVFKATLRDLIASRDDLQAAD